MENASKALIIAGAILLSIALIGVGMYVFQIASGSTENIGLQSEQAAAYNAKFIGYEGTKTGNQIKAMLKVINTHNNANQDDSLKQIIVAVDGQASGRDEDVMPYNGINQIKEIIDIVGAENTNASYTVEIGYSTTGLVKFINIRTPH